MLTSVERLYAQSNIDLRRIAKVRWLSLTRVLDPSELIEDKNIEVRLATEEDIAFIENHAEYQCNIVKSAVKFWRMYGFRTLYLGFFDGEKEPTVFQYVLDHTSNHLYEKMEYGGMYEKHSAESAQIENIYLFRHRRKNNAVVRFESHLFSLLYQQGIRQVRCHIYTENRVALRGVRRMGCRPDHWIVLVLFNFPLLRKRPMRFHHLPLRESDYDQYPLALFKEKN